MPFTVTSSAFVNPVQVEGKLVFFFSGWEMSMETHISDHEILIKNSLHSKRFPGLSEALQASKVI